MFPDSPLIPVLSSLIDHSTKPATKRTYTSSQRQYIEFCETNDLYVLPSTEESLLFFIAYLFNKNLKGQSIKVYLSAIHHLHTINGFDFPQYTSRISAALKGASVLSSPPVRTKPITFDILSDMFQFIEMRNDSLMMKAATSVLFFGCLRAGEICLSDTEYFSKKSHVCLSDVSFNEQDKYMTLFLKKSKTDRHSNGVTIYIGCSRDYVCGFCRMKEYVTTLDSQRPDRLPLFMHHGSTVLTKSYLVNATKLLIGQTGRHSADFTGHSYRAGSATTAGSEAFSDYEVKLLGRWESSAYHVYLRKPSMVASFAARLAKRN